MNHLDQLRGQPRTDFRLVAGGSLILYLGDRPDERSLTAWRLHVDTAWRVDGPSAVDFIRVRQREADQCSENSVSLHVAQDRF